MSAERRRRAWQTPPARHPGLAPPLEQRQDSTLGKIAVACFLLAIVLVAIMLPELF